MSEMISQSEVERLQKIEKTARELCRIMYNWDEMLYQQGKQAAIVAVHMEYRDLAEALGMKVFTDLPGLTNKDW